MKEQSRRFLVTPPGFDDIGAVLTSMGEGFKHESISWETLLHGKELDGSEVLFINCSGDCEVNAATYTREIASRIRNFVSRGGSLYVSDWAGAIINAAFSEIIQFDPNGIEHHYSCDIKDPGLREIIGKTIDIHFDLGSWWRIRKVDRSVRVYVTGGRALDNIPIVAGFSHGQGHVIYTSFHNEKQVSATEKKLLEFLVLRPILADTAASAEEEAKAQHCVPGMEIIATIDRKKCSNPYTYDPKGGEGLLFILHWQKSATLKMNITDPGGTAIFSSDSSHPPLKFEVPSTAGGRYACVVEAISVPHDKFPYVLTLATRRKGITPPVKPIEKSRSIDRFWPCYILIDCCGMASGSAPQIGRGIKYFIQALSEVSVPGLIPAVSLVQCREGLSAIHPPKPVAQLVLGNITCSGKSSIGVALTRLTKEIERTTDKRYIKPMIVIVLGSEPADDFSGSAASLKNLISQGRVNVAALSMNPKITDITLQQLSNIPLRVGDYSEIASTDIFKWLSQAAEAIMKAHARSDPPRPVSLPRVPHSVTWIR